MPKTYNKGEWSELYTFIKLLKEGKIYSADENACRIDNVYLPIIKLIREEQDNKHNDYFTGETIKIFQNGIEIRTISANELQTYIDTMFQVIFNSSTGGGAFAIAGIEEIMATLDIEKVKASSAEKVDISMQIHDIHTGYEPEVGFSIKSDVGSPPTLLNAGKNTRIRYKINGITRDNMNEINAIDSSNTKEYMKERINQLLRLSSGIEYHSMLSDIYEDNLVMIDSALPRIYGELILQHYLNISNGIYDCKELIERVAEINPMNYRRDNIYAHKIKKLLCASALGMTPGKEWDGLDAATGGYIIIKRDGEVLCYHLYNRNFFEEYLLNNTRLDRPSASRYDYGYIYELNGEYFIDLNVQIRFKSIRNQ